MKDAETYNIGYHRDPQTAKTKKAASPVGRICSMDATNKRRTGDKQRQAEVGSSTNAAHAFLKSVFLPKLEAKEMIPPAREVNKIEADFYNSLDAVAMHYNGFLPMDTRSFSYPYNIALSVWEVEKQIRRLVKHKHFLQLVRDEQEKTFFICEELYNTGTMLYYLPIVPLYKMYRNRRTRKAAHLLFSVCSYLYCIADIPYYRQENTYIYWQYEMLSDWIEEDDEAEIDSRKQELDVAYWCGDKVEQKLCSRKNLDFFSERIKSFRAKNDFETECLKIAKEAFLLYSDYPDTRLFKHAEYPEDEEMDSDVISMRKYISFIANGKGWLFTTLIESVNNEFNEYSQCDEPTVLKKFDGSSISDCNLEFEGRLFPLLEDICYLLTNY